MKTKFKDAEEAGEIDKIKQLIIDSFDLFKKEADLKAKNCLICGKKIGILTTSQRGAICKECWKSQPSRWQEDFKQSLNKRRYDITHNLIDFAKSKNYEYVLEGFLVPKYGSFEYMGGHPDFPDFRVVSLTDKSEGIVAFDENEEVVLFTIDWHKVTNISADTKRITKSSPGLATLGILAKRSDYAMVGAAMRKEEDLYFMNVGYESNDLQTVITFKGEKAREAAAFLISERARYVEKTPQFKAESSSPQTADDPIDQIKKLGELREAGLISQEEFEEKKKDLLSKI